MDVPTGRFGRADRLLKSRDFELLSRQGHRVAEGDFVFLVLPGACRNRSRIGISASRRVGNAVVRNRIKRGIREWFRRRRDSFPAPWDLVVIARRGSSRLIETGAVGTALDRTLNRARTQWTQR